MGCGNSTATSAAAGRGKRVCRAWVSRERQRQRGGAQFPRLILNFEPGARLLLERPRESRCPCAGAVTPGFRGEDSRLGPAAGLCTLLGSRISQTCLWSLTSPFCWLASRPHPGPLGSQTLRTPGKVLLSKSGLFWGWGRVPVGWGQQPAGL